MKQYLDILQNILVNGKSKLPFRKTEGRTLSQGTIGLANVVLSHDMSDGFPLLTTKKMGLRNIAVELEGFIKGITDKKWFKNRKCNIWNEWANPKAVKEYLKAEQGRNLGVSVNDPANIAIAKETLDDLGPIYGYQWRHFGKHYGELPIKEVDQWDVVDFSQVDGNLDGYDQFQNILDTLKTNPTDRRMVCSAWNPCQMHLMALPPCHMIWNVTVYDDKLSLCWMQRSVDTLLGLPYNIASYALLLLLLARHANLEPGNLTGMLVDCHLYENQLEAARQQLTREPKPLPRVYLPDEFDINLWDHTQLCVVDYDPHPPINKVEVVV